MLLNRVLTVQLGVPGSHRRRGWEEITAAAIDALVERLDAPLVAILWGKDAQSLEPALPDVPIIASAHPSPMSADRGFFAARTTCSTSWGLIRSTGRCDEKAAKPLIRSRGAPPPPHRFRSGGCFASAPAGRPAPG